ncbi:hypothetical protein ACMFMG_005990 [Clarireedia jacksonii]
MYEGMSLVARSVKGPHPKAAPLSTSSIAAKDKKINQYQGIDPRNYSGLLFSGLLVSGAEKKNCIQKGRRVSMDRAVNHAFCLIAGFSSPISNIRMVSIY